MREDEKLRRKLQNIADEVVEIVTRKDAEYGSSWKSHGGFSAFFNLDRKFSRVVNMAEGEQYDLFEAMASHPESGPDALKDLIGYAMLTLSETHEAPASPRAGCGKRTSYDLPCGTTAVCGECFARAEKDADEDCAHVIETQEMYAGLGEPTERYVDQNGKKPDPRLPTKD